MDSSSIQKLPNILRGKIFIVNTDLNFRTKSWEKSSADRDTQNLMRRNISRFFRRDSWILFPCAPAFTWNVTLPSRVLLWWPACLITFMMRNGLDSHLQMLR